MHIGTETGREEYNKRVQHPGQYRVAGEDHSQGGEVVQIQERGGDGDQGGGRGLVVDEQRVHQPRPDCRKAQ